MTKQRVTRREFVQDSAAVTAGVAVGAGVAGKAEGAPVEAPDPKKTRSYNENMEYRRLGRTNLMISAVSIGGHWKKIPYRFGSPEFKKNRREVLAACMDHGINYIDACWNNEVITYAEALKGRRDGMFFGCSNGAFESRFPRWAGSLKTMKQGFEQGLKDAGIEHVDLWRITMHEQTRRRNNEKEIEIAMEALAWAKKTGKARFTGVSSHDRPWIAEAVTKYPELDVIVTPHTPATKQKPKNSMYEALRKKDVGMIGIKPFGSGSVFESRGVPDSPTKEKDDEAARMALRYVLRCDALTAAIPGLITIDQVRNAAKAVTERREFDAAEAQRYQQMVEEMWANLPHNYKWLRDWEWV